MENFTKNRYRSSLCDGCTDLQHQLEFPTEITSTTQWFRNHLVELTVPFEENINRAHEYKSEKYEDLQEQHIRNGCKIN